MKSVNFSGASVGVIAVLCSLSGSILTLIAIPMLGGAPYATLYTFDGTGLSASIFLVGWHTTTAIVIGMTIAFVMVLFFAMLSIRRRERRTHG